MVLVEIADGRLEGELVENEYGGSFYSFKGIPYAEPPVEDLRFKAPQPKKPWSGIHSAKQFGPICPQFDPFTKTKIYYGDEDCLYLNVYSPDIKPAKPLPVMFWIHGGAFISGSGNDDIFGPHFLVRKNVVLVTFNYRLEVLGFLCLDTKDIPGNAGMKDQVAALRWVKKNISNFGGDPENITIFGESTGGACVGYHLISPMTKGLFRRAIAQSGSLTSSWAQCWEPRERALSLARSLGCNSNDDKELYDFFKSAPKDYLTGTQAPITHATAGNARIEMFFSVVSEKEFKDEERYFYGDVYDALRDGIHEGVEIMTGFTSDEGFIFFPYMDNADDGLRMMKFLQEMFVPKQVALYAPLREQLEIGRRFRKFFDNNSELTPRSISDFWTADMFLYPGIQLGKFLARKNEKVYIYEFTCKSERNVFAAMLGIEKYSGRKPTTCHADDIPYLFNLMILKRKVDTNSLGFTLIDRVTSLWTNFAKFGNPTPDGTLGVKWLPYTLEEQDYMEIGNQLIPRKAPYKETIELFDEAFKKYFPKGICKDEE